jgi:hypothetical protein
MILKWVCNGIAKAVLAQIDMKTMFISLLKNPEIQDEITAFTDELYTRYAEKVIGTLGVFQREAGNALAPQMPQIINKNGKISVKSLIPFALEFFMKNRTNNQSPNPNIWER